jgi:serine/threonine protein phosphatase PrpC
VSSSSDALSGNGFETSSESEFTTVTAHGAWSSLGRRKTQEDGFILHEINNHDDTKVLLSGVLDGHGGNAASSAISQSKFTIQRTLYGILQSCMKYTHI